MANEQTTPTVAIPLSKGKLLAVQIGCVSLMLSITMLALSLSVLQGPILTKMNAMEHFSLLTIFAALGIVIMTPIGGKLGDIFGRRTVVVVSGTIAAVCGIGLCFATSIVPFMVLRLILSAAQGAFTAAPYIITAEVNERKQVPKIMGILASSVAVGGFVGSIIAGALTDAGFLSAAIAFPVIPLVVGVVLIGLNLPNKKQSLKAPLDILGIIALTLTISALVLSLNFGSGMGWLSPPILIGFALALVFGFILTKVENKAADPVLPMRLFRNKQYTMLLIVGFLGYFYMSAMNAYAPLAVQQVLQASTTASGALQLPRTAITMILPTFVGVWIGKKKENFWKGMAISAVLILISFVPLSFCSPSTSLMLFMIMLGITGIAESFRGVTVTAAAQSTLEPKDIGVGTAMVNFFNALSGLIAAAINGVAFNAYVSDINKGVNMTFMIAAASGALGLFLVLFFVRRYMKAEATQVAK